jgi:3-oxoadipate enol-lactonase
LFITTDDGVRLHAIGSPAQTIPVVFSNSLGTDVGLWDTQLEDFAGRSVWRYDTRGHGRSGAPAGEYSIERLGKDLLAIIDATGAAHADVCGVSIGGITALWAAIHAPHRVRRIVLANTAAKIGDVSTWNDRIAAARANGLAPLADASMLRWFTEAFRDREPAVIARFRSTFERTSVDGYAGCCAALRDADLRAAAARVQCPALVVTGRHDPATPPELGRSLAATIGGAQIVEFEAAHLSNVECAHEFTSAVKGFLSHG